MSTERFIHREFTNQSDRTTVRLVSTFDNERQRDVIVEVTQWDADPFQGASSVDTEAQRFEPTLLGYQQAANAFREYVTQRV